jgi:anti-anti-sigma factor
MFFSVSSIFENKRKALNQIAHLNIPLTSEEALKRSTELDHFVVHFQNRKHSELEFCELLKGSTLTITLKGQLDINTSEILLSYMDFHKNRWSEVVDLHIDMTGICFFDTTGIRSLLLFLLEARRINISIKTINLTKTAYNIIEFMGIPDTLKRFKCGVFKIN